MKFKNQNYIPSFFLNFKTQMDSGFKKVAFTNDNGTPLILGDDFADVPADNLRKLLNLKEINLSLI